MKLLALAFSSGALRLADPRRIAFLVFVEPANTVTAVVSPTLISEKARLAPPVFWSIYAISAF